MAKSNPPRTRLLGRDAEKGTFKPVKEARADKKGSVVERVPLPGYGDTGRSDKKKS